MEKENRMEHRQAYVIECIDTEDYQYKASERKGCKQYYAIFVRLRKGQAKCPNTKLDGEKCGKRTRYDVNNNLSMSRSIHDGPYATREAATNAATRANGNRIGRWVENVPDPSQAAFVEEREGWF